ncbi:hypothetical protein E6A55_32325 (plasmid) [Cupriavidus necator H16]|uniref:fructose-bisphosphatase n=2 Tax=Cupriavidus necator TaxID=106590 RepID=Q7WXT9_CUPNH|nr:fructose-1,6-bisphosphate [Cupriavidus necator H16]QCC05310.1 hypothetical protein E6A55_32325 [Cupriavidus necator H16]
MIPMTQKLTFTRFVIAEQHGSKTVDSDLIALLLDVSIACRKIASSIAKGSPLALGGEAAGRDVPGEIQSKTDMATPCFFARSEALARHLAGMASEGMEGAYPVPLRSPQGRYLLVCDPLDGSANIDVNVSGGIIFSVLRCPEGISAPEERDLLQAGSAQMAAGYALYDAPALLVLKTGSGIHGFTLDADSGQYVLTHPNAKIPQVPAGSRSALRPSTSGQS